MSTINRVAHGLTAGQRVVFSSVAPGGTGLDTDTVYFVLAAGLTANAFQVSETDGGTPLTLSLAVTSASMQVVPETTDTDADNPAYAAVTDPTDVQAPPTVPPTPTAPTVTSVIVSGIVRLQVTLNDVAEAKVRAWEIQITHKYDGAGNPDWTTPAKLTLPEGSVTASIPALGSTVYSARVSATDVYGTPSAFSAVATHTTLAGSDALAAALAALANDVSDGIITTTKIADGSISTPKLQAGSVTAQVLAATIVLASLIKTANSGRRIEVDIDGIRLYDTDESLLVRIPTNGDPVFIKGQINADSLVSQTAATFRGAVSLESNAAMTLQTGITTPGNVPSLAASVDSLALGSSPVGTPTGIGYDSGAGTFWIAADVASGYVAHEYNATTGAFVRSILPTGSTFTMTETAGATSHVSDTAQGIDGSTNSHISTSIAIPAGIVNVKITKVSAYFAGHNGTCAARVGLWDASNNSLRESATFSAASGGATGTGNSSHYDKTLSSPYSIAAGASVRAGFRHTDNTEGFQFDRDDGSGKTTYSGDGSTADGTGWGTLNSSSKPNIYITYTHDIDTRLETAPMIGVCTDGTYIYTLDTNGVVWKYNRSTLAYVAKSAVIAGITGTKSQAGLFYDAVATQLVVTTSTGTGAGVYPKFQLVDPPTLSTSGTAVYNASAGTSFSGTTDTFRGGARLNDPLNGSAVTYWVATTSGVYAYTINAGASSATQTANRDFGQATTMGDGLTHDGTQFRGYDSASPTKIWKFTNWDWTTASAVYWVGYSWYDSNATGGTHETAVGPRGNITLRRRERLQVQNAAIPTGGVDDPNNVRIYMLPNASNPGAGSFKLQVTDALTSRLLVDYASGGAADGAGTAFPAGTPAIIHPAPAAGWWLKGDGSMQMSMDQWIGTNDGHGRMYYAANARSYYGTQDGHEWRSSTDANIAVLTNKGSWQHGSNTFPTSPSTGDIYYRTDLHLDFYWDGSRWLSVQLFTHEIQERDVTANVAGLAATTAAVYRTGAPLQAGGSDIYLVDWEFTFDINAGTALSGSHKWDVALVKIQADTTTTSTILTDTINSGALNNWRRDLIAINALLTRSSYFNLQVNYTKTGTPGPLIAFQPRLTYRIVAT